jgi:hypothetical protein
MLTTIPLDLTRRDDPIAPEFLGFQGAAGDGLT